MAAKPAMARRALCTAASRMGGKPRGRGVAHPALGALEQGGSGAASAAAAPGEACRCRRVLVSVSKRSVSLQDTSFTLGEWQRHVLPCAENAP